MRADPDFSRFRLLHTGVTPSILNSLYRENIQPRIVRLLAKVWVALPHPLPSICPLCCLITDDEFKHIISDCQMLNTSRNLLLNHIQYCTDHSIADEFRCSMSDTFLLKVLGAPLSSAIMQESRVLLLQYTVFYAYAYLRDLL